MSNSDAFQDWYEAFLGEMIDALEPFGPRHDGTGDKELFRRFYVNSLGPRTGDFVVGLRSVPTKDRAALDIGLSERDVAIPAILGAELRDHSHPNYRQFVVERSRVDKKGAAIALAVEVASLLSRADILAADAKPEKWTESEVAACVHAYLQMLHLEQEGSPYVKSVVNANLREGPLIRRTKASVEYRMQNVSAVLEGIGHGRIEGYVPAANVGPTVRSQILRLLGAEGHLDPEDYELSADPTVLDERSRRIRRRGLRSRPSGNKKPTKSSGTAEVYLRDPSVVAWVLEVALGQCELCAHPAPFTSTRGEPYLEVHHVVSLGAEGPDTVENAAALCPNCHRRCHYSDDAEQATAELYRRVDRLERVRGST